jgi:hypothetical protein
MQATTTKTSSDHPGQRRIPKRTTLLDLVFALQATEAASEDALVAAARERVLSGAAVLCGTYAGSRYLLAI